VEKAALLMVNENMARWKSNEPATYSSGESLLVTHGTTNWLFTGLQWMAEFSFCQYPVYAR
jgi:hypothetical protein